MRVIGKGAFTAIGSWPHTDVEKITDLILERFRGSAHPDEGQGLAAWPQLPKLSFYENMYVQFSEGLPCIVVDCKNQKIYFDTSKDIFGAIEAVYENYLSQNYDYFRISEQYAKGLYSFGEKIKQKGKAPIVKGQILGPVSFGLTLTDENKRLIFYNEQMQDAIIKVCAAKSVWQARFLKKVGEQVIIFIDEPYLVSFGSAYVNITREKIIAMINEVIEQLHREDVITGIHCCGSTDWSIVTDTNVDILNFDAYNYSESIMIYPQKINAFLSKPCPGEGRGKNRYLAWGIVPTSEDKIFHQRSESLFATLLNQQKKLASLGTDEQSLIEKTIITPSCGTGSLSEEASERVIELLEGVSTLYKEKFK